MIRRLPTWIQQTSVKSRMCRCSLFTCVSISLPFLIDFCQRGEREVVGGRFTCWGLSRVACGRWKSGHALLSTPHCLSWEEWARVRHSSTGFRSSELLWHRKCFRGGSFKSSWGCSSPVVQRQNKSALLFHLAGHPNNSEEYHTGFYWGQPYISSGQWPLSVVSIIDLEARLAWANLDLPNEECDLLGNSVWGCARVRNAHESPLMDQKQKPF